MGVPSIPVAKAATSEISRVEIVVIGITINFLFFFGIDHEIFCVLTSNSDS